LLLKLSIPKENKELGALKDDIPHREPHFNLSLQECFGKHDFTGGSTRPTRPALLQGLIVPGW